MRSSLGNPPRSEPSLHHIKNDAEGGSVGQMPDQARQILSCNCDRPFRGRPKQDRQERQWPKNPPEETIGNSPAARRADILRLLSEKNPVADADQNRNDQVYEKTRQGRVGFD